jgi:uncharacterized membrane protein HdeD (DUF308 family)
MSEQKVADNWGWFVGLGLLLIVLGLLALGDTVLITIAVMMFCGIVCLFGAGAHLVHAFYNRNWAGFFLELALSAFLALLGVLLFMEPVVSAIIYTLLLGIAFLLRGGVLVVLSFMHQRLLGWLAMLLSGLVTMLLGALIIAKWPGSGIFILGLFIGIDLIFNGASWVALGLAASQYRTPQTQEPTQAPTPVV